MLYSGSVLKDGNCSQSEYKIQKDKFEFFFLNFLCFSFTFYGQNKTVEPSWKISKKKTDQRQSFDLFIFEKKKCDQKLCSPEYVPASPRSTRLNRRALAGQSQWKQPTLLSIYSYIKQVQYFLPLPSSVGCPLCSTKGPDTLNWRLWWIAFEVRSLYRCRGFIPAQSSSRLE